LNYDAIIFDIDGTLIDYDYAQYSAVNNLLESLSWKSNTKPLIKDAFELWYKEKFEISNRPDSNDIGFYDQQRIILENFLAHYGIIANSTKLAETLIEDYKSSWRVYPDVLECLFQYEDIPMHIISNGNSEFQRLKLTNTGIDKYFDEVLISGDIGIKKPDIRIFQTLSEQINVNTDKLIYIGDRIEVDAKASSDAGMLGIWINRKRISVDKTPKLIKQIFSLNELDEIIK
tara:strand:+ start:72 stop:764 length:693 start_codon:yes stop_codon:yes gene_type:complete